MSKHALLILFSIVFFGFSHNFALSEEGSAKNISYQTAQNANESRSNDFYQDQYIKVLELSVNALEKTNNALTQRWTPVTVFLTLLSVLFSLITIVWAIFFGFWFNQQNKIEKNRKNVEVLENNVKNLFEEISQKVKEIDKKDLNAVTRSSLERIEITAGQGISQINNSIPLSFLSNTKINLMPGTHALDVSNISNKGDQTIKINGVEVARKKNS